MIDLVTTDFRDTPGMDTGVSHALAKAVGSGSTGETFRIHATRPVVAFGRRDRVVPGYPHAVAAARRAGFLPVERLAGGRAAVFHEDTLAFSWVVPADDPRDDVTGRFTTISGLIASALRDLGANATVGELPGEYCPGRYSVHLDGRIKVVGVGQRLVKGAAHVGGVIVVGGGRRVADVLKPVYRALEIDWDPTTAGDLREVIDGVTPDDVTGAVVARLGAIGEVRRATLPPTVIAAGRALAASHLAPAA